jgi:hypothetical protein
MKIHSPPPKGDRYFGCFTPGPGDLSATLRGFSGLAFRNQNIGSGPFNIAPPLTLP